MAKFTLLLFAAGTAFALVTCMLPQSLQEQPGATVPHAAVIPGTPGLIDLAPASEQRARTHF